jgi:molybdopterin synthase sulfur carrier subunit
MLNILYFAWIKERMERPGEAIELPTGVDTVGALAAFLQARDEHGARAFAQPTLIRAAVNQDFASPQTLIKDNDEVAFFPPVTGG